MILWERDMRMRALGKRLDYRLLFVIILVLPLIFSGCMDSHRKNSSAFEDEPALKSIASESSSDRLSRKPLDNSFVGIPDTSDFDTYCAKEKSQENRIYFNYPQLKAEAGNAEKLNEIIRGLVGSFLEKVDFKGTVMDSPESWNWNHEEYTNIAMVINYRITRYDSEYLSVIFEGTVNQRNAAHPNNYFDSLTIDLTTCEVVTLSDLYRIDSGFLELVQSDFRERVRPILKDPSEKAVNLLISESWWEGLPDADNKNNSRFHSFMTDGALGISITLGPGAGYHLKVFLSYDELVHWAK